MIRRSFFQILAAAILPKPQPAAAKSVQGNCPGTARGVRHPTSVPAPGWLQEWRRIPKLEISANDLTHHQDPHQRELGKLILRHIGEGSPFSFLYNGGSEPGTVRTVLPVLLFVPAYLTFVMGWENSKDSPCSGELSLYVLGWCQPRQAARTFRLDRIDMMKPTS